MEIGRERAEEVGNQIVGLKAQVASIDSQLGLNKEELGGVQTLYSGGYAPKTRLLALQRSAASLQGDRGEQVAAIARAQQTIGETRIQVLATQQAQISEAAAGLETAQDKIADVGARLAAAKDALTHIEVRAPVTGTVLNLTQFTEGGVVGSGEPLLEIVPSGAPLIIEAKVQPRDAHALRPGLKAQVTLTAYNTRTTPKINAEVVTISADQTVDPHTGKPYFTADLKIPPDQLKRLSPDVKIYPGMPVSASIINGERTVLSYVLSPFHDALSQSMHEQ
jgi:HlyD family secretion protein/epimerase transport system membrane fusion protein